MDEAEVAKQKDINVLMGNLDAPNQTFLVDCHTLDNLIAVTMLIAVLFCTLRMTYCDNLK